MSDIQKFIKLAKEAIAIAESGLCWSSKYDLVFSDKISVAIKNLDIRLDWCDPDTTYQDDVLAYVNALRDKVEELEKIAPDDENRQNLRRLIEFAYRQAWGPQGCADDRDEWRKLYSYFRPQTGGMIYLGYDEFSWSDLDASDVA